MSDISFKKFIQFVELDGEPSDEQINEIFGLFRNNDKLDKLKKERERLKGMDAKKKAELDKALIAFANNDKPGKIKDIEDVLSADDRKFLAKQDKHRAANQTGKLAYENTIVETADTITVQIDWADETARTKQEVERSVQSSLRLAGLSNAVVTVMMNGPAGGYPVVSISGPRNKIEDWLNDIGFDDGLDTYIVNESKYVIKSKDGVEKRFSDPDSKEALAWKEGPIMMIPPNIDRLRIAGPSKKKKSKSGNEVTSYPVTTDFASARNSLIGILGKPTEDRGSAHIVKWKKSGLTVVLEPIGSSDEYVISVIMKPKEPIYIVLRTLIEYEKHTDKMTLYTDGFVNLVIKCSNEDKAKDLRDRLMARPKIHSNRKLDKLTPKAFGDNTTYSYATLESAKVTPKLPTSAKTFMVTAADFSQHN